MVYRALSNTLLIKYVILYATYSILTSRYQIPTFPKNQPSSLGCYFSEKEPFFELVIFPCFRPNPYTRMCVSTIGSFSLVRKKMKTHGETPVESCFVFVFSAFGFLCLFELFIEDNFLGEGGRPPSPPLIGFGSILRS